MTMSIIKTLVRVEIESYVQNLNTKKKVKSAGLYAPYAPFTGLFVAKCSSIYFGASSVLLVCVGGL